MTYDQQVQESENLMEAFAEASNNLIYNDLPKQIKVDMIEDAIMRIHNLAMQVGVDPSDFF